jgi:hypothetical protein
MAKLEAKMQLFEQLEQVMLKESEQVRLLTHVYNTTHTPRRVSQQAYNSVPHPEAAVAI